MVFLSQTQKELNQMNFKKLSAVAALLALAACSKVQTGYVGVEVNQYGSDRGVQNNVLGPGSYFTGWNTSIYEYPTFTQNYAYTASANEGRAADESITFQAKGGIAINADFGINYHVDPSNVPVVFQKYHKDMEAITDGPLRNLVRDSLNDTAGEMSFEDIANDIPGFMGKVNVMLKQRALANGITVESLSDIGKFRWPDAIQNSINAAQQAKLDAITSQNQLQHTQAENAKRVANADADLQIATKEAQATQVRAEALNKNPEILQQMWIDKWNGQLPVYQVGGGTSMQIQLPATGK
jgi:regulator of protease activity HflC (stomatin/prohibitin superfamily)